MPTLVNVAHHAQDLSFDPAVVVVNPDDEVIPEAFNDWLAQLQSGEPLDLAVTAAETLSEARTASEV